MAMTRQQIVDAIEDRLGRRWKRRCLNESAAPVCVIAIKQLEGPGYGTPVVCTMEDMDAKELAALLHGIAIQLLEEAD